MSAAKALPRRPVPSDWYRNPKCSCNCTSSSRMSLCPPLRMSSVRRPLRIAIREVFDAEEAEGCLTMCSSACRMPRAYGASSWRNSCFRRKRGSPHRRLPPQPRLGPSASAPTPPTNWCLDRSTMCDCCRANCSCFRSRTPCRPRPRTPTAPSARESAAAKAILPRPCTANAPFRRRAPLRAWWSRA